jgi:hypothetical protein
MIVRKERIEKIAERIGGTYADEMRRCAVSESDTNFTFEPESPCYKSLMRKYSRQRLPLQRIPDDYDPDKSPDSPRVGGCCDPPKP